MTDQTHTLSEKLKRASGAAESELQPDDPNAYPEMDLFSDEEYRAFVSCRGTTRQAEMLIVSFKNGTHDGFEYSHRYRAQLDSNGIVLLFSDHEVHISGLRLWEGYLKLAIRQVLRICEADQPTAQLIGPTDQPLITKIEVKPRDRDDELHNN